MGGRQDDRIPLRFAAAAQAEPHEALLIEDALAAGPLGDGAAQWAAAGHERAVIRFRSGGAVTIRRHGAGCLCCAARGSAAAALAALFQARALGEVAWFTGVVAVVADAEAVAGEVRSDRVAASRFRVLP